MERGGEKCSKYGATAEAGIKRERRGMDTKKECCTAAAMTPVVVAAFVYTSASTRG